MTKGEKIKGNELFWETPSHHELARREERLKAFAEMVRELTGKQSAPEVAATSTAVTVGDSDLSTSEPSQECC